MIELSLITGACAESSRKYATYKIVTGACVESSRKYATYNIVTGACAESSRKYATYKHELRCQSQYSIIHSITSWIGE